MSGDDAFDDAESDAGAFELSFAVEALEGDEEFVAVFHVEAGAVVLEVVDGFVVLLFFA